MHNQFCRLIEENSHMIHSVCDIYAQKLERSDLIQEIIYNAWRSLATFKNNSKFSTWLYSIARNICLCAVRRERLRIKTVHITDLMKETLAYQEDDIQDKLLQAQRYDTVIEHLSEQERNIFILYMDGIPYKEIELRTGINENYLRVKINRISKRLKLRYGTT